MIQTCTKVPSGELNMNNIHSTISLSQILVWTGVIGPSLGSKSGSGSLPKSDQLHCYLY